MHLVFIWTLVVGVPIAGDVVTPSAPPMSATLVRGQVQVQELTLAALDRLHLSVVQPHLDIEVRVIGPSGSVIASAANPPLVRTGTLTLTAVAAESGLHRIEVRLQTPTSAPGPIQLTVDAPRPAGAADRRRIEAERLRDQADHRAMAEDASLAELARKEYAQSTAIWRELDDPLELSTTLQRHGEFLDQLGELSEAQGLLQEALTLEQRTGNKVAEVDSLDELGVLANELGDPPGAVRLLEPALALRRSLGPDAVSEGSVLNNLAVALEDQGDFATAVERYSEALGLARTTGDGVIAAIVLKNRADGLSNLGQFDRALADFREACLAFRSLKAISREGVCEFSVGSALGAMHRPAEALIHYRRALPLLERVGDRRFAASSWSQIGLAELELGRAAQASAAFDTALAGHLRTGDRRWVEITRANQAKVLLATGRPGAAAERLEVSRRILHDLGDRANEAQVLTDLARAELALGRLDDARGHLLQALQLTEAVRSSILGATARAAYLAAGHVRYGLLVEVLMELHSRSPGGGWAADALRAAESARARSFLELLSDARVDIRSDVPEALRAEERALDLRLEAALRAERRALVLAPGAGDADRIEQTLEELRGEREVLQARMRAASPGYRTFTNPAPLDLAQIRSQVLDADTVLVEYFLGDRQSYLWVLSPESLTASVLPGRKALEAAALGVYRAWSQPSSINDGRAAARALSRMVLGPVASALAGKRLLLVADGALQTIPFGALPDPTSGRALLASHAVVYAPSASALAVLRQGSRPSRAGVEVAILADPVFGADDARLGGRRRKAAALPADLLRSLEDAGLARLPPLTATRREAEAIARHAGPGEAFSALGFDASRATALGSTVAHAAIVHLATHAFLDTRRPELSGVVLSMVDRDGGPEDGFLSVGDLYRMHLDAELVVLSACRTGLGKEIRGEGLVGLTRGFMYAGAPRVVASLWKVSDRATARLMDRFYAALLVHGLAPAEALRKAQLELADERGFSAPFAWAAFVLQGEWRPMGGH